MEGRWRVGEVRERLQTAQGGCSPAAPRPSARSGVEGERRLGEIDGAVSAEDGRRDGTHRELEGHIGRSYKPLVGRRRLG